MKKLVIIAIIGVCLYWSYQNGVDTNVKNLFYEWENKPERDRNLNAIESKLHALYFKLRPSLKVDMEKGTVDLKKSRNYRELSLKLTKNCKTAEQKAKAIYTYIIKNIEYDTSYTIYEVDECFEKKRGVCQAYSELFVKMAHEVGVKAIVVAGHVKGKNGQMKYAKDDLHAWLLIEDNEGNYYFADPTWDSGGVDQNGNFAPRHELRWFHCDPELAIITHYPLLPQHQLTKEPIARDVVERLPFIGPDEVEAGIKYKALLAAAKAGKTVDLPKIYTNEAGYEVKNIPHTARLRKGRKYVFEFTSNELETAALTINNDFVVKGQKKSRSHRIEITPDKTGELSILLHKSGNAYLPILTYKVI